MERVFFYLVRHAPVIGQAGIAYGRDAEIDEHCHDLFNAAASQLPKNDALWIASEFPRAQKTAAILQKIIGVHTPLEINAAFNEQNFGTLAGRKKSEIFSDPANKAYLADMVGVAPPGGESVWEMTVRMHKGLQTLLERMSEQGQDQAVIVCHGGIIRALDSLRGSKPFDLGMKVPPLSVYPYETRPFPRCDIQPKIN